MVVALPGEQAMVQRAVAEPAAFAAVYDHYFPRVYNYVRYRIGDATAADDVTALVFERALANLARYRPDRAPFAAWLFCIARNAVIDHLRRRRVQRLLSLDVLRNTAGAEPSPPEAVAGAEKRAALLAAVARLSERERDLIALRFAAGLTNRRIAELTGLSASNVGVILYRAVQKLREEIGDAGWGP